MRSGFVRGRCLKCRGNVYLDEGYYGWYEWCLQCSYTRYLEIIAEALGKVSEDNLGQARKRSQDYQSSVFFARRNVRKQ